MLPPEKILWKKIENFQLDDPHAHFQFSTRLARENGWTKKYALRVVEEYKKFLFLCCVSETGVTPSDPVDQAWHLHLTYTRSYWIDLCKNTLQKDIHHNPTKGGRIQAEKFEDLYSNTLQLYKVKFSSEPPGDIWHSNEVRFSDIDFQRVNRRKYWLINKYSLSTNFVIPSVLVLAGIIFIQSTSKIFGAIFIGIAAGLLMNSLYKKWDKGPNSGCTASGCGTYHHSSDDGNSGCSGSGCSGCGGGD